jgi:hypothetical protein
MLHSCRVTDQQTGKDSRRKRAWGACGWGIRRRQSSGASGFTGRGQPQSSLCRLSHARLQAVLPGPGAMAVLSSYP